MAAMTKDVEGGEKTALVARLRGNDRGGAVEWVRLLGAVHIVLYHASTQRIFISYAYSWVYFFMVLSGFGPAYSKLGRSPSLSPTFRILPRLDVLWRRLIVVYPIYILATIWPWFYSVAWPPRPFDWMNLLIDLAMLQVWGIGGHDVAESVNIPLWYVSTLAHMWLVEEFAFGCVGSLERRKCLAVVPLLSVAWVVALPLWCELPYVPHSFPFMYLHLYLCGVALAFYLQKRAANGQRLPKYTASFAALALLIEFSVVSIYFDAGNLPRWSKQGISMPLYCLLVAGLTEGDDPLASLLNTLPYEQIARDSSYALYAMQSVALHYTRHVTSSWWPYQWSKPLLVLAALFPITCVTVVMDRTVKAAARLSCSLLASSDRRPHEIKSLG